MFEYYTRRIIEVIVICFIVVGIAVCIWNAIPSLIKIIAIILIIAGFIAIIKK